MQDNTNVAVLIGSLRQQSISRKLAQAMRNLAPAPLKLDIVEIGDLPFYNQEFDEDVARTPSSYDAFRAAIKHADGVLFITPEYNRSIPAVLKNAADVGSRPYGKGVWAGKPAGVVSVSMGALGGFGANQDLRRLLGNLDMPTLQQPEVYISNGHQLFDEAGSLTAEPTADFLRLYLERFSAWVERHTA
jgi:chromate reductase, NAD(P)H dehydrogenase (quinone)